MNSPGQQVAPQPPPRILYDINHINSLTHNNKQAQRTALLILAKASERAERYDDVCRFIREIIKIIHNNTIANPNISIQTYDTVLSSEERQLMWFAYKQSLLNLRNSLKIISRYGADELLTQTTENGIVQYTDIMDDYRHHIELEIANLAGEIVNLLENTLLKTTQDNEHKTFYLMFVGNYYKILSEVQPVKGYERRSLGYYAQAYKLAQHTLPVNHSTRLNTSLYYSVCLYEIFRDKKAAIEIAKTTFDNAIHKLDELDEYMYKDSTLIMQLLRDNITLWTSIEQQGEGK